MSSSAQGISLSFSPSISWNQHLIDSTSNLPILIDNLSLSPSLSQVGFSAFLTQNQKVSPWFLPDYAKENPLNWAPLCQLEADIEKQLPIGIWINWESSTLWEDRLSQAASLRLRLFNF